MRAPTLSLAIFLSACGGSSQAESRLPNQPAIAETNEAGTRVLAGWSVVPEAAANIKEWQKPDNIAFAGAELWMQQVFSSETEKATLTAFTAAGMQNTGLVAATALSPDAIDVLDSHSGAHGYSYMVEGELMGQPAYGIAISLYGSTDGAQRSTGVHAFMAPKEKFKALGGFSVVAAKWFHASAAPDENMRLEGSLAPQAATDRLSLFFSKWVEDLVLPLMGQSMQVQMQTIQNMQSWNNAMNACAGDPGCRVAPMNDGSGGWTSEH